MQKVSLDLIPGCVAPIVYASQYDDGRVIRFMLTYGGPDIRYILNASEVITCNLTKPDGTKTVIDVANPGAGKNDVDLVNGADDYDQEGVYSGEIVLTRNSTVKGTANFILKVEADAYDGQVTTDTATGNPCTFSTDLADNLVSLTAEIVAGGGNGTPDNPIPINGYTEANITRCGVNIWNEEWELGGINESGQPDTATNRIRSVDFIPLVPNTTYYIKAPNNCGVYFYDDNQAFISANIYANETITPPANARYLKFTPTSQYGTTYNNDISINYPSTDTTYHAYNGQTYTIAFGQTVYGGVLDVTRGKLHVTWWSVDLGTLNYSKDTLGDSWRFSATMPNDYRIPDNTQIFDLLCSIFKTGYSPINSAYTEDYQICGYPSDNHLYIKDTDYSDANAFKTAMSGVMLAYVLATPFDIDLTPVQISALIGTNNITSDLGGDVNVTYIKKV